MRRFWIIGFAGVFAMMFFYGTSFATPVTVSFGGGVQISDVSPLDGFSELINFGTGRIFSGEPTPDPLVLPGGYTSKNRVEITDLFLGGTWHLDDSGTPGDPYDDYTVFDFSPTLYTNGFKIQNPLGTIDYLIADLKAVELKTRGASGNINANELKINLVNVSLTAAGIALNSGILNNLNSSTNGNILTITMQYSSNLDYAIKSGVSVNASFSGTLANPATGGGGDENLVPEPSTFYLLGMGIIGIAFSRFLRKRKTETV